jgi:phytoene synthase
MGSEQVMAAYDYCITRADDYYRRSQPGISLLNPDCHLAVNLSGTLYRRILDHIRLNNYNVFTKRASVPLKTKLMAASQYWFMQQFELIRIAYEGSAGCIMYWSAWDETR